MDKKDFMAYLKKQVSNYLESYTVALDNGENEYAHYCDGKINTYKQILFMVEEGMFDFKSDETV